ncbi:MMPL family transporter [Ectobacillus sp. JY-23]|uniref:MMPL family transporter n=1 Tax=Ectobacillus sp. JY-23 TaxID=2933872 RepID=UPI001FF1F2FE|nr:MMPL family transporter [Ectobacillus sp. JY-23]UOY92561.1 MMPL family transporter [Ectobacillus sp. JY-23]
MRTLLKLRWVFLALWAVLLTVLLMFAPNMEQLVREKGNITIPDEYSSMVAHDILERHNKDDGNTLSAVLVFHDKDGITGNKQEEINSILDKLKEKEEALGLAALTTYRDGEELREQLVSKDNQTILTLLEVERQNREVADIRAALEKVVGTPKVEHYFTGESFIGEDVVISSQNGLHKTEIITVVFILFVLILVFRSVVAPLIPLLTVGISYVASAAVVAYLVDWFSFPLSNFTQIFMVAILFGIGTDYCILLLSRFKEELPKHESVADAIIKTYQTAGRTVFFSALAVLIGFSAIGLSKFSLYQSATGVAVGILVLLIAFVTLVPLAMYALGPRLFWPAKSIAGHGDSKLWSAFGTFSLQKPLRALLLVAIIVVPLISSYDGKLSFNSLNEIGEDYGSVKGFNTIADSFGPGEVMPVQVVIEGKEKLDSEEALAIIEKVSREVAKLSSVEKVRSATRPLGEPVEDFYVADQADSLQDGLGQGNDGLSQIKDGLTEAKDSLAVSGPKLSEAVNGFDSLINGTKGLQTGLGQIQAALTQVENGVRQGSMGAGQIKQELAKIQEQVAASVAGTEKQAQQFAELTRGLQQLSQQYSGIEAGLQGTSTKLNLAALQKTFSDLESRYDMKNDTSYQALKGNVLQSAGEVAAMQKGLAQINQIMQNEVIAPLAQSEQQFAGAAAGQKQLADGLGQIVTALGQLEAGIGQAADGQSQIIGKFPQVTNGLSQVTNGQQQLKDGFAQLPGQLGTLRDGLGKSADGIGEVTKGLESAQSYLKDLNNSGDKEMTGFYIPSAALENSDFQQVFDQYLSEDKEVAKLDVVLKYNPYSNEALEATKDIKEAVKRALRGSDLEDANIGVSGVSAVSADMLAASNSDYSQTVIYMLIGITLILVVMLRSLVMPLYLIVSLLLCFYSSLAINELIFVNILGYDGINWTMPFFGFVLLMALGVDYSIFLMDRFNEYKGMKVTEAMLLAMRNMGTVIFSAVIILGGTFAAMYPSGVLSLLQIATIVLAGLLLYALVFLPFFIPVMVKLFGRANWFPFDRNQTIEKELDM